MEIQPTTNNDIAYDINHLLVSAFKDHNITIYGTWEDPLFKAKDIGDMLDIQKVRDTISKFEPDMILLQNAPAGSTGGLKEQYFLTEDGLYELLFRSRKPLAKEFRVHVSKLLKQQRLELGEKLQLQARKQVAEERERHLIDKHKGKPGVYFLKHLLNPIIKFGCSDDITKRVKDHKKTFNNNVFLDKVIETFKYKQVERVVKPYANATFMDAKEHNHTEIIEYENEDDLNNMYNKFESQAQMIEPPEYNMEIELQREINRGKELDNRGKELDMELIKLRMEYEKTHQNQQAIEEHPQEPIQEPVQEHLQLNAQEQKIYDWCDENIVQDLKNVLKPKDIYQQYDHETPRNGFYKILNQYFEDVYNTTYKTGQKNYNGENVSGYKGFALGE